MEPSMTFQEFLAQSQFSARPVYQRIDGGVEIGEPTTKVYLDRLIRADGVQGGTIHTYNRRLGVDVTTFTTFDEWKALADHLLGMGKYAEARLVIAVMLDLAMEGRR